MPDSAGPHIREPPALHTEDLDLATATGATQNGRGGRRRTVGIEPGAAGIIQAWIERRETPGPAG